MSHAAIRWTPRHGFAAALGLAAFLVAPSTAAGSLGAPTRKLPGAARPEAMNLDALRSLYPSMPPRDLPALAHRLEVAWGRAKDLRLFDTLEGREALERVRLDILGRALLDTRPGHEPPTDAQLMTLFLAQGEERQVSHLVCRTEEEGKAVLDRLRAGEDFSAVAAEVSIDPTAAQNAGDLGWMRQNQLAKAFGDPVFTAAPGALIGPFQTEFGWHVAKVRAIRKPTPEAFPAAKQGLLKEASEALMAGKRQAAMEGLRDRYSLRVDMAVLGLDRTLELAPGDEKRIAGRVAGQVISLRDLKLHMGKTFKSGGSSHSMGANIRRSFMEGLADRLRLAAAAKALGLHLKPSVRSAIWAGQRQQAYLLYTQAYLDRAEVPEPVLAQHHASHPDRFLGVGALRLQVLVADSEEACLQAAEQVRLGMPWQEAAARFGSAEATGNAEPGWIAVTDLQKLVPPGILRAMTVGPMGQAVGPFLAPDGWTILNVKGRRPGPTMQLADCRDQVRADYLKDHGTELVDQELAR